MAIANNSFHNSLDTAGPYVDLRDRRLAYRFFPHLHPYVLSLVQRLNEGGVAGLLDSDTLYVQQSKSQPLTVIPNSTRAMLTTAVNNATRLDGTTLSLVAGTPLTLPDGTNIDLPNGGVGTLPGHLPVSSWSTIQFDILANNGIQTIDLPDFTEVILPAGATNAVLSIDGTLVNLPPATHVTIRAGLPLPVLYDGDFFNSYHPDPNSVQHPYPVKNLDFSSSGAYSIYNWEIFFHVPLLIATHLSQNQKYQDAQRWFHYVFNPSDNSPGPTPQRFWKVLPFQSTDVELIGQILLNLSTKQDPQLHDETVSSIDNWKSNPFQPFAVAKYRPTAYMLKTVMAYLDNVIAWGDSLFQQFTIETIKEATQLYVMAANILGPKPQATPMKGTVKPLTYNDLSGTLDEFGNELREMEADIPFDISPPPNNQGDGGGGQILASIGKTLYFCIPRNQKLLAYWDTVADRLFKIHNSLNLQGTFQQLPLFDPPIDPALLVRAAAAGLDVSAILSGLNQPLPLVRFQLLVAKAAEICQEVKSLGANLLAAIEKQDNEALSLLRSQHENALLGLAESVKYSQWQEAIKAREGIEQTLANAIQRYTYYQKMLGRTDSQIQSGIPQLDALDQGGLDNLNLQSNEPQIGFNAIDPMIAQDSTQVSDGEIKTLSIHEVEELSKLSSGRDAQVEASEMEAIGAILGLIPQFDGDLEPVGVGVSTGFGGVQLHALMSALASVSRANAEESSYEANKAAKLGSYSRREQEWLFQSNLATGEMNQIFKQLRGAQIREAIAQKEYRNHQVQMQQAQEILDFLQGNPTTALQIKETTVGFYAWMKRELKALHSNAFQLAFEVAKKAERALQNELGDPSLSYIHYNYLDGTEGLLGGEKLLFDIKAMEMAYHDLNQREYEMTKHVSLLQTAPLALVQLRATGTCSFTLPEELFDLDCPGHYFRRIKSVAVTVPCVAGPYTSINCTLRLEKSSIRIGVGPATQYARAGSDDARFNDYYGTIQAIVTSSGKADSGTFEADERYLPFERAGIAGSAWQLSLPAEVRQIDFDTITDIILHVRYTGREGGDELRAAATQNLQTRIQKGQTVGSMRLFSVRHEFPSEWAKFRSFSVGNMEGETPTATLSLSLLAEHYPFWAQAQGLDGTKRVQAVELFAEMPPGPGTASVIKLSDNNGNSDKLTQNPLLGNLLAGNLANIARPYAITDTNANRSPLTLYFDNNLMKELWVAITWGTN